VPISACLAILAFVCSLAPDWRAGEARLPVPADFLSNLIPMFRAYARFGMGVSLGVAILAGLGFATLVRSGNPIWRVVAALLVAGVAFEYLPSPPWRWRDVLPTEAHRWVVSQPGGARALDCVPPAQDDGSVPWLTRGRIVASEGPLGDCAEPRLGEKLAAEQVAYVIVPAGAAMTAWRLGRQDIDGLRLAQRFEAADVYAAVRDAPPVVTIEMIGFFDREFRNGSSTWRWMGPHGAWRIRNTTAAELQATVEMELRAFATNRRVAVLLDGRPVAELDVGTDQHVLLLGPLVLPPGDSLVRFEPAGQPDSPRALLGTGDSRALSIAVGEWEWRRP
jgi:hypothetical protein